VDLVGFTGFCQQMGHVKPNHFPMGYGIPWGFDGIRSGSGWELLASSFLAQHTYIIYFMTMIFGCILVQYTYIIKLNNIYIYLYYICYTVIHSCCWVRRSNIIHVLLVADQQRGSLRKGLAEFVHQKCGGRGAPYGGSGWKMVSTMATTGSGWAGFTKMVKIIAHPIF